MVDRTQRGEPLQTGLILHLPGDLAGRMQALGVGVDPDRDQQMGRMSATAGAALDGAGVDFEARQIQPPDDAPNLARWMLLLDQAFDIERLEPQLLAIEGKIARGGGVPRREHL